MENKFSNSNKKLLITGDVTEIEKFIQRDDIEILYQDLQPCEQSFRFQDYIMAVFIYRELM